MPRTARRYGGSVVGTERIEAFEGQPGGRPSRARAYAAAQRHSSRVRLLRRAIPIGAGLAIAAVAAVAVVDPFGRLGIAQIGPLSVSGTKITMENPRLSGFRQGGRPYEVTATAAHQDVRKPTLIELETMRGKIAVDDEGGMAHLEAATGVFDSQKEQLQLHRDIRVRTDKGERAELSSADIDFKAGTVSSKEPVSVAFSGGTIRSDALEIRDSGKVITFIGRVQTVLEKAGPVASAAADPSAPARTSQAEPTSLKP